MFVYIIPARLAVDLGAQQATCTDAAATRTAGAILLFSEGPYFGFNSHLQNVESLSAESLSIFAP